jgi:hypothetical protein
MRSARPLTIHHAQVLRTDLPNSSPSVMLLLEHARYTFNCGESMQRLLCENKIRLSQVHRGWHLGSPIQRANRHEPGG